MSRLGGIFHLNSMVDITSSEFLIIDVLPLTSLEGWIPIAYAESIRKSEIMSVSIFPATLMMK